MEELRDDFGLHLLELLAPLRDENAQGRIRRDYLEGMRHLAFMMKLKFSFWEELPYALCGVAHYEESKARSAAQACLAKFEDVIAKRSGDSSGMHALTIAWLSQGTLRDALVLFAQGVSRNDLRLAWLKYNCARLLFVPILERSVEGRHAVVKKATLHARNHNGSYVSCRLRVKELLDHGHRTPVALQEIAAFLGQVRIAKWLMRHVGLAGHPAATRVEGDVSDSLADKIVYRLDAATQFADLRHAAAGGGLGGEPNLEPVVLSSGAGVLRWAALDHFRETLDPSGWFLARIGQPAAQGPDDGIRNPSGLPFQSLAEALSPSFTASVAIADDGQIIQFEDEDPGRLRADSLDLLPGIMFGGISHKLMLFRVAHLTPSSLRRARGDTSARLMPRDIGINIFDVEHLDQERHEMVTRALPLGDVSSCMSSALAVINESLFSSRVYTFEAEPHILHTLPPVDGISRDVAQEVTNKLVSANALPGEGQHFLLRADAPAAATQLAYLRACEGQGLVVCERDIGDATSWVFTARGVAATRLTYSLREPRSVLKHRNLEDRSLWTRYELMSFLSTRGWGQFAWRKGMKRPLPLALAADTVAAEHDGELVPVQNAWYFRPHHTSVNLEYLRGMVAIEEHRGHLLEVGVLTVPHNAKQSWYSKLVEVARGEQPASCLALLDFEPEAQAQPPKKRRSRGPRPLLALPRPPRPIEPLALCDADADSELELPEDEPVHGEETPPATPPAPKSPPPLPPPPAQPPAPEAPVPAATDAAAAVAPAKRIKRADFGRSHQEKSGAWGAFTILYRPPRLTSSGRYQKPSWQASCPFKPHNLEGQPGARRRSLSTRTTPKLKT